MDHVLGLLSLREGNALHIHATPAIEEAAAILGVTAVLQSFCGVIWHRPDGEAYTVLQGIDQRESSLRVRVLPLSGRAPRYAGAKSNGGNYTVALHFTDERTGGRLLVAPGVPALSTPLRDAAGDSDAVLMDGTFWSEDELSRVRAGASQASEMGHLPIKDGTLPFLSALTTRHRVYVHINNTNPIFLPDSPERKTVEAAGAVVGHDGMSFNL